jgi:hypothetical protein
MKEGSRGLHRKSLFRCNDVHVEPVAAAASVTLVVRDAVTAVNIDT